MNLQDKQKDIVKAILEYLNKLGCNKSFETLLEETGIQKTELLNKNTLESKWNTILLLQNKNKELENQLKNLKEDIERSKLNGTNYNLKKDGEITMVIQINNIFNIFIHINNNLNFSRVYLNNQKKSQLQLTDKE